MCPTVGFRVASGLGNELRAWVASYLYYTRDLEGLIGLSFTESLHPKP